jgi:glycerophosphoryl diester phosphodiesterase
LQVPTLEEELQLVQGLNKSMGRDAGVYPEIKEPVWHRKQGQDISRIVLDVLARYGYRTKTDKVYVQCFDFEEVRRIRGELGYQGRLVQLLADGPQTESVTDHAFLRTRAGLGEVAKVADGVGPPLGRVVTGKTGGALQVTDLVRDAHALGLQVHVHVPRRRAARLGGLVRRAAARVPVDAGWTGSSRTTRPGCGLRPVAATQP